MCSAPDSHKALWSIILSETILPPSSRTSISAPILELISLLVTVATMKLRLRTQYCLRFFFSVPKSCKFSYIFLFRPATTAFILPFPRPVIIHIADTNTNKFISHNNHHSCHKFCSDTPAPSIVRSITISVFDAFIHRSTCATKQRTFIFDTLHSSPYCIVFQWFLKSLLYRSVSSFCSSFVQKIVSFYRASPTSLNSFLFLHF